MCIYIYIHSTVPTIIMSLFVVLMDNFLLFFLIFSEPLCDLRSVIITCCVYHSCCQIARKTKKKGNQRKHSKPNVSPLPHHQSPIAFPASFVEGTSGQLPVVDGPTSLRWANIPIQRAALVLVVALGHVRSFVHSSNAKFP